MAALRVARSIGATAARKKCARGKLEMHGAVHHQPITAGKNAIQRVNLSFISGPAVQRWKPHLLICSWEASAMSMRFAFLLTPLDREFKSASTIFSPPS